MGQTVIKIIREHIAIDASFSFFYFFLFFFKSSLATSQPGKIGPTHGHFLNKSYGCTVENYAFRSRLTTRKCLFSPFFQPNVAPMPYKTWFFLLFAHLEPLRVETQGFLAYISVRFSDWVLRRLLGQKSWNFIICLQLPIGGQNSDLHIYFNRNVTLYKQTLVSLFWLGFLSIFHHFI